MDYVSDKMITDFGSGGEGPDPGTGVEGAGSWSLLLRRWATKKAGGSSQNGRDSQPKNLGVKKFGGQVGDEDSSLFTCDLS